MHPIACYAALRVMLNRSQTKKMKDTISTDHPLIGTWIAEDEDSDVAISIEVNQGLFSVSAFCRSDGEYFKVSNVVWDRTSLSFEALMPSTKTKSINKFTMRPDGNVDLELTIFEVWKKKNVKPGEIPEAWK